VEIILNYLLSRRGELENYYNSTQLNSTGHTAKCSESQSLWQLDQMSWDESRVIITAPDWTQLNQLRWVELSPVWRCDRGFAVDGEEDRHVKDRLRLTICEQLEVGDDDEIFLKSLERQLEAIFVRQDHRLDVDLSNLIALHNPRAKP